MIRAFYREATDELIITPYRCGSTHLILNISQYDLIFLDPKIKKSLDFFNEIKQTCKAKTFIWRNPFERLTSFYYNFIFANKSEQSAAPRKLFAPKLSTKNFWSDFNSSLNLIEKNWNKDQHTIKQNLYFEIYNQNISDYTFIDISDYTKWLFLSFGDKVEKHSSPFDIISGALTMTDIVNMLDVKDKVEKLYYDDYLLQTYITRV